MAKGRKRILCIDGGGVRGLIPALVLAELERRVAAAAGGAKPLHRCFDMIAGTSTGGIIAAGLVAPRPGRPGKAACSAADLVELYRDGSYSIFPHDWWNRVRRAAGWPYSARALDALLARYLGTRATTRDALTNVVIPAYDLIERRAVFMAGGPGYRAARPHEAAYPLHLAARATSAAPTYFTPAELVDPDSGKPILLIDGGVFANDPSLAAIVEATKLGWPIEEIELFSLGTGRLDKPYPTARRWLFLDWVSPFRRVPILSILMQAGSSTISYQARALLGDAAPQNRHRYFRADCDLPGQGAMDDPSPAHLAALTQRAAEIIRDRSAELTDWAARLAAA